MRKLIFIVVFFIAGMAGLHFMHVSAMENRTADNTNWPTVKIGRAHV